MKHLENYSTADFLPAKTDSWSTTKSITKKLWKSAKATVLTSSLYRRMQELSRDKAGNANKNTIIHTRDADANDGNSG